MLGKIIHLRLIIVFARTRFIIGLSHYMAPNIFLNNSINGILIGFLESFHQNGESVTEVSLLTNVFALIQFFQSIL